MATNALLCALCDLRHLTTPSTHWCPECQEALCSNCNEHHSLSKSSRNHQVIPVSEYIDLPSRIANIDLFCTYHNEKYIQYCVKHECPICYKCIKEHGKCSELILLEELTHEVKSSEPFRDMEQCLTDVKMNINRIREDSKSNIDLIASKKKQIIEEMNRLKSQIVQHLDKLQEDLMKELDEVENKCCVNIASNISSVDDQDKEILQCNTEIENLKKYASDIQTFLGMKDLQQKITKHEKFIQSLIETKKLERVELEFINNATIQKFLSDDMRFGSITVKSFPSAGIELVRKKYRQAQISITDKNQSVHNVNLLFRQKLKTSCGSTRGGCATANGEFLFINYQMCTEKLVVVSAEGNIKYEIPLSKPYSSFDITCLDDKTVAVSTGESDDKTGIIILDLGTRVIKEFVALPSEPFGITFDGKSLICCCDKRIYI
ncbi:unnamed protein product [Mytilus edulis]|uniref:B box-type domain-containing protein n=1 Tax=Mytilus edulis TaxID=6550 RepID=A0A8S3SH78_MYTED|nr:unnamed protein product [Mytilus edulis]